MLSTDYTLHRVEAADWPKLKALRLEMLADTPLAYLETLAAAQAEPDSQWQFRARRSAQPENVQIVAVTDGGDWVGTMASFLADGRAWLVGVYLNPEHRGGGASDQMLTAVENWARGRGADQLWLEVHEDNQRAQAFYRRHGYTDTGARVPYPLDPAQSEIEMSRAL